MNNLEKKYKETLKTALEEIKDKLISARKYLNEAINISEKYGIPFYSSISFIGQEYRPESFDEKWKDLRSNTDEEDQKFEYDEDLDIPEYVGWQHSSVC